METSKFCNEDAVAKGIYEDTIDEVIRLLKMARQANNDNKDLWSIEPQYFHLYQEQGMIRNMISNDYINKCIVILEDIKSPNVFDAEFRERMQKCKEGVKSKC